MVEASRERQTLHVITSDRALGDYVRRCGARVVGAEEFRRRMDNPRAATGTRNATVASSSDERRDTTVRANEVNEWMRYFGVDAADDKE
jgi:predicted RNA-binding protein with PIN domain